MHDVMQLPRHQVSESMVAVSPNCRILVRSVCPAVLPEETATVQFCSGYWDTIADVKNAVAEGAALDANARYVTQNYRGHGADGEKFISGLSSYFEDINVARAHAAPEAEDILFVGHSIGFMGAVYSAYMQERVRPGSVRGIIGLAPVPALLTKGSLGHKIYKLGGGKAEVQQHGRMSVKRTQLVYSRLFLREFQDHSLLRDRNLEELRRLNLPVHVLMPTQDKFGPPEHIEKMLFGLTSAKVTICSRAIHTMHDEESLANLASAIRNALQEFPVRSRRNVSTPISQSPTNVT